KGAVYRRRVPAGSSSKWVRLGVTAVAAVVVAEAAAWLLRPRDIEHPVHADESAYFSHAELMKARDYASGQRLLLVGGLVAEGAVRPALVDPRQRRRGDWRGRHDLARAGRARAVVQQVRGASPGTGALAGPRAGPAGRRRRRRGRPGRCEPAHHRNQRL